MDIFRVLTRGASLKKDKSIVTDYSLPNESKKKNKQLDKEVDKEIDFFRTKKFEQLNTRSDKMDEIQDIDTNVKINEVPPLKILNEEDGMKLRKSYKGNITGNDIIPLPIGSFQDLISRFEFDKVLLNNLIEFGFKDPTPIQKESIPITLHKRDILSCSPTGSGKTLAFLIPLIQQIIDSKLSKNEKTSFKGLIISPTRELASQIYEQCVKLTSKTSIHCSILTKSLSSKLKNSHIISKKNQFDILITTPLRLIDLIQNNDQLDLSKIEHLIFDEADKLFDDNFLKQTDEILSRCTNPNLRKSMFSATIPSNVEEISNQIMFDPIRIIIGHKEGANNQIHQKLIYCGNEEGKLIAIRQLIQEGDFKPPVLIFLQSITRAKALFHELLYDNLKVDVIHAERTQFQREKIIENFRKGEIWVLICTDILSRGIDFKGVNLVINYDVPNSSQSYVHRIGRTGRGDSQGTAITFYTKEDSIAIKPIVNVMKQSGDNVKVDKWLQSLTKISKKDKKNIKKGEIKRRNISTVPKVVKQKKKQKKDMIQASKKRKLMEYIEMKD